MAAAMPRLPHKPDSWCERVLQHVRDAGDGGISAYEVGDAILESGRLPPRVQPVKRQTMLPTVGMRNTSFTLL